MSFSETRIAVPAERNCKLAVAVAVAAESFTANKNSEKNLEKKTSLYFFLIPKFLRLASAVDRRLHACCCGCGRDAQPQFGVRLMHEIKGSSVHLWTICPFDVENCLN